MGHLANNWMVLNFTRPKLKSEKTEYDLDLIPHSCDYKLIAFYPVVIKVALSNIDNLIVLGSRICTTTNGNISANFST